MRLPNPARIKWNYQALSFAFPCLGMLGVMLVSGYIPFGKYSMLYSDMYHQYYPFFLAFSRSLKRGQSLLYSWNVGMGIDYLSLISYYLASPLNLLSVLVPEKWMLGFYSLLMPVKLGFAGLFFSLFLKKIFNRNDFSVTVFSAFYGVCAWALGFQWNIMWLDTFALTPLVILGEISLLKEGKFLLYTLTLALSIFANYYIGLFVCIFVGLIFFCYEICRFAGWKKFFLDLGKMAVFSALAIGMTLILTLPTVAALQTTQSSVNKFPTGFRLNIATKNTFLGLLDAMRKVAGNMGGALPLNFKEGLPNLYCGVGSILFAVLYLLSPKVSIREKLCAVFLLLFFNVSFIIRQLDYIWHGFHFTNMIPYRFSYLHSFVLLYMAYRGFTERMTFCRRKIGIAGLVTAAVLCCSDSLTKTQSLKCFGTQWDIPVYILYNFIFLALYVGALLYGQQKVEVSEDADEAALTRAHYARCCNFKYSRCLWLGVCFVEVIAALTAFGLYFPGTYAANYPKGKADAASAFAYIRERESWNPMVRTEVTHCQTLNDGALNDYYGITAFTSSANVRVTEFMRALGYGAKNTYNRYAFEESSPVANLLLNLRYMVEREGHDRSGTAFSELFNFGSVRLLENNFYLPLGFLSQKELALVDFPGSSDPFVLNNTVFSAATGLDPNVFSFIPEGNLEIAGEGLTLTMGSGGKCSYSEAASGAAVYYRFTADKSGFACVQVTAGKNNDIILSINGVEQYRETMSLPQMMAVSDVNPGDIIEVKLTCKAGESSSATVRAAILDMELFRQGWEILNQSTLKITSFKETRLSGTIDCNRDGLLYTSIPFNGNWVVYVDGRQTDITLVGDCMMAAELTQGRHSVDIVYRNQAFRLGALISALCGVVFFGIYAWCYRPKWLKKNR